MHRRKDNISKKLYSVVFLVILFLSTGFSAFCQKTEKDSVQVKKPVVEHSARKATIYSAVLPGLGQIYNRKYWKVPLVYGGFAAFGYFINFNNRQYQTFKQAYSDIVDNDPYTNSYLKLKVNPYLLRPDKIANYTEALLKSKDYWRRCRDYVIIWTGVFYAVNIIDASVDAHFFNFDVGDDLTFNWAPGPMQCMGNKFVGVQCRITF